MEFILLGAGDTDGVALDLGFDFRELLANKARDLLGFILVEAFAERNILSDFEVTGGGLGAGVEDFLADAARSELLAEDIQDGVDVIVAVAGDGQAGLVVSEFELGTGALHVVAGLNLALGLINGINDLGEVIFGDDIK